MPLNIKGNVLSSSDVTSVGVFKSKLNRDGLICYLDAASKDSYSGAGTTWTDLTGNGNNGSFTGGVTFNSSIAGGVIVTDGSGYITISTPSLVSTNYTIMGAAKYVTVGGRVFSALNNNWLMGWWSSTTENYYAEGWVTASQTGPSDTNWRICAATGNIGDDLYSIYVNAIPTTNNGNGGSQGPNGFSLGRYAIGNSEYSNAYISYFLVYNRILSPYEIAENFQATRGRFGI